MTAELKHAFSALTEQQQALVLAAYAHELTMLARAGYEAGTVLLSDPSMVRRVNEVQHRVTSAIFSRLNNCSERYPDDVLIDVVTGGTDRDGERFRSSFRRAWHTALGSEFGESLPK
ncbi:MAG: hypothetical protein P4N60_10905 [Verrucomicrobiae bacterium]|nr:hypothetical protein [Verrucomicrobiae bacterium]